jgi:hypothetical protein
MDPSCHPIPVAHTSSRNNGPGSGILISLLLLISMDLGCGGSSPAVPVGQKTFNHVIVVIEENHSYSQVIGNSSMPYFNSLASQNGLATQYFADGHPSIPNYLALTTGATETFDDSFSGTISDDNVVRELTKAGKSWKAYAESIPSQGYLGPDTGLYLRHHVPFTYFSDVQNDSSQAANVVDFSQFPTDLANNNLPNYSFIVPNIMDDAHNGTLAQADSWLQTNIAPLLSNSAFQSSGLLIITFDEGEASDLDHQGGHIATLIVSSQAKKGYQSTTVYQHPSTLRLTLAALGVNSFPGEAASAPDMSEFFNGPMQ